MHLRGSLMMLSFTPSSASHAAMTALANSVTLFAGTMRDGFFEHLHLQRDLRDVQVTWLLTGAPAMIASKSSGYRCASIIPWRPPVEQPW